DHRLRTEEERVFLDTLGELLDNTPKALTDLHAAEGHTRSIQSDRFVFELLQNARDAAARAGSYRPSPRVLLRLHSDTLLVANDGAPFSAAGYNAIRGIGKSPKPGDYSDAPAPIGRKVIGF